VSVHVGVHGGARAEFKRWGGGVAVPLCFCTLGPRRSQGGPAVHGVPACAQGDPLGRLRVTPAGVARRDELVWEACRAAGSPVLMLLSGGEQLRCAGRWQACRRQPGAAPPD
jgi:hypothetical protein